MSDLPPLEAHLGYWLRYVSNQVSHAFAQRLADRGVTVAEWVVMRDLHDRDAAPSELADRLGMTRGAISKLVDRLEAKALLARAPSPTDKRTHTLALTAAGRALVPDLSALADANDDAFFGHLTPERRAAVEETMKEIVERLGLRTIPLD